MGIIYYEDFQCSMLYFIQSLFTTQLRPTLGPLSLKPWGHEIHNFGILALPHQSYILVSSAIGEAPTFTPHIWYELKVNTFIHSVYLLVIYQHTQNLHTLSVPSSHLST